MNNFEYNNLMILNYNYLPINWLFKKNLMYVFIEYE